MRIVKFGKAASTLELTLDDLQYIEDGMGVAENEGQISNTAQSFLREIEELRRQMEQEARNTKPLHPSR
jgi:ABC-type enterochelin transport system substrate-binding protein